MDSIPSISKPINGEGKPEFNTLDEPIRLTIVEFDFILLMKLCVITFDSYQIRDLKAVGNKFFHVLYPRQQTSLLTECESVKTTWLKQNSVNLFNFLYAGDLWGPLILCTFMAL
jgi:hypothetical protein